MSLPVALRNRIVFLAGVVVVVVVQTLLLTTIAKAAPPSQACIPASVPPANESTASVFARATAELDALHYEEAAISFRYLAMHHVDDGGTDVGERSAPLYLKAAKELASRTSRPSCWDDIERDTPRLATLYCANDNQRAKNANTCNLLDQIQADVVRAGAQKLEESADRIHDPAKARPLHAKAGAIYIDAFSTYCEVPLTKGKSPISDTCDELAFLAFRAYRSANDRSAAIHAQERLIALYAKLNRHTPLEAIAEREVAAIYRGLMQYEKTAEHLERAVTRNPQENNADDELSEALFLRVSLGQVDEASRDLDLFMKLFGATSPVKARQDIVLVATYHADHEAFAEVRALLDRGTTGFFDQPRTPLDVQIQAHTLLARAGARPKQEYETVRSLYATNSNLEAKLRLAYGAEPDVRDDELLRSIKKRVERVLLNVAEAKIAAADDARHDKVDAMRRPLPYVGGDHAALMRYVEHTWKPWVEKKTGVLATAMLEYQKIASSTHPEPPAASVVVLSESRQALAWAAFVDELRAMAGEQRSPTNITQRAAYVSAVDAIIEPIRATRAKPALLRCVEQAKKLAASNDDHARACETWLAKQYKAEHYVIDDEIMPTPRAFSGASASPLFLY